jgi:hypothetical protein
MPQDAELAKVAESLADAELAQQVRARVYRYPYVCVRWAALAVGCAGFEAAPPSSTWLSLEVVVWFTPPCRLQYARPVAILLPERVAADSVGGPEVRWPLRPFWRPF